MERNRLRRFALAALTAWTIALVSATAHAQDARRAPADLTKPYAATLGQMVAVSATTFLQTLKPIDAPMMVIFNGQKIEIWVLGVRHTRAGARETLMDFQEKAWPPLVAMIQGLYGVKLQDSQVVLSYRNRLADDKEVLRREDGQYVAK